MFYPSAKVIFPPLAKQFVLCLLGFVAFLVMFFAIQISEIEAKKPLEKMYIEISRDGFQKLSDKRKEALRKEFLFTEPGDLVSATIRFRGQIYKARLRLKGDATDHFYREKYWSFRIKIRKDKTLLGMKKFSIQSPSTRMGHTEWLFHAILKREGLIGLKYKFINVNLNGEDWGTYALEEHFDWLLIESNKRREGVILAFDEDYYWREAFHWASIQRSWPWNAFNQSQNLPIKVFNPNRVNKNPQLKKQYKFAVELLDRFRSNLIDYKDALDTKKWGTFMALVQLLGAHHAKTSTNIRFYYNPITNLLEPIGYDAMAGAALEYDGLYPFILRDSWGHEFPEDYMRALEHVSDKAYLQNIFRDLGDSIKEIEESVGITFTKSMLFTNAKFIRNSIRPEKSITAFYVEHDENCIRFKIRNSFFFPVQIQSVSIGNSILIHPQNDLVLPGTRFSKPSQFKNVEFPLPDSFEWLNMIPSQIRINYKGLGHSKLLSEEVQLWKPVGGDMIKSASVTELKDFEFLQIDEGQKRIILAPGKWKVSKKILIPKGYEVICGQGLELNLTKGAAIISNSPVYCVGKKDSPIVIKSDDLTGQGLAIIRAEGDSFFHNVIFQNLGNPSLPGLKMTGGVNFYQSKVNIWNCVFQNNRAKEGLSIIGSTFRIEDTVIQTSKKVALNIDSSRGELMDLNLINSREDALVIAKSELTVDHVKINGAGRIGISLGQKSILHTSLAGQGITIHDVQTGLTATDLSLGIIYNLKLSNVLIGLATYEKNPEYGPGILLVWETGPEKIIEKFPLYVDSESLFILNGSEYKGSIINISKPQFGLLPNAGS